MTWEVKCGDALDLLREVPEASVPLVFADPPYGVGKADWDGSFAAELFPAAARVTSKFLLITPGISNIALMPPTIGPLVYKWTVSAWIANGRTRGAIGFGNWIPALVYAAEGQSVYRRAQDAKRIVINGTMPDHPSPKPIEFMRWIVQLFSAEGDTVLDPCCGSGSTGVACAELGRDFLGFELDETYCDIARRRIGAAQPALAMMEAT